MKSSFSIFLNEGLIKLPPKLIESFSKYFIYWYLSFLQGNALKNKSYDLDDQEMIKVSINKLAKLYNVDLPSQYSINKSMTTVGVFKNFNIKDIPNDYIQRIAKINGEELAEKIKNNSNIKFTVTFKKHSRIDADNDSPPGIFFEEPSEIIISIPNMIDSYVDIIESLSQLNHLKAKKIIDITLGNIEHETTHAIQSIILSVLHNKQFDLETQGKSVKGLNPNQEEQEKYFTSDVEFDPWIKNSIRELKEIFSKEKANTELSKKDLFIKFTYGDINSNKLLKFKDDKFERSDFFKSLKRSDFEKWKKAIKLISQSLF